MPPFSGKKKKEQLQAKRQRKRDEEDRQNALDRERERLREELVNRGEDVTDDLLDAYMRERHPHAHDPARGRRAHRREREQKRAGNNSSGGGGADGEPSDSQDDKEETADATQSAAGDASTTMMYSADRQHGVRSVFAKESAAVLAARKQLSYKPIPFRTTMPATGIPFGEWFTFPSNSSSSAAEENRSFARTLEAAEEEADGPLSSAAKAALVAAEQERRMERPLVATTAEALGGGSGSVVFPFAVELPSRGWHLRSSGTGDDAVSVEVEANTLTAPAGVPLLPGEGPQQQRHGQSTHTDPSAEGNGGGEAATAQSQGSHSSRGSASSEEGEEEAEEEEGALRSTANKEKGASGSADQRRAEAALIRSVEQRRFDAFVRCLDAYPLPSSIAGLEISSYERNVEVWQQLWRTVELSDVLVVVADARYPILHAHLGLLAYITKVHKKPCVLVLNKEDLVPASTLRCWQQFLYRYLSDLGFLVDAPAGESKDTAAATAEGAEAGKADGNNSSGRWGRIVLRTFTTNPRPETAGQLDGDVDVTRRQKHRKGTDAKMYEKLRTGKLNATKHLQQQRRGRRHHRGNSSCSSSGSDSSEDNDSSDDGNHNRHDGDASSSDGGEGSSDVNNLRYGANENFAGMRAAEHALQHDRRAYKELAVVAQKITELLALCRRLGKASRAARGVVEEDEEGENKSTAATAESDAPAASGDASQSAYATSALPCPAPRGSRKSKKPSQSKKQRGGSRATDKDDQAECKGGERPRRGQGRHARNSSNNTTNHHNNNDGGEANDDSDAASDVFEDRAPDSPSYVHIGFIGHPNVGKSSLLNCIRGTKVVSVSATPGHTKHIQTIPVPEEHLTLVDSPGLALPVFGVPRPLQAVLGTHQIAQTRDPQSGVSFLAAYLPIERLYGLQRPEYALQEEEWSSYELCEAYAKKRGYYVKHGKGALDIHRAAIAILQEAYEGRLALFYAPPELNVLQSAWYRERVRPQLLLTVFGPAL